MVTLILAGGTGTRLWPLSRESKPKQFQRLIGRTTLFQQAVARARRVGKPEEIYVATNSAFVAEVRRQAPRIPVKNIIAEPAFRDTATCLGYAAMILESRHPGQVCGVLYADHVIREEEELTAKLRAAEAVAQRGKLVIIEVKSLFPATQLGWVQVGKSLGTSKGEEVMAFERFCEKPNWEKAVEFHRRSEYLWNTGLYVWRTDVLLEKFAEHVPDTYARLALMRKEKFGKVVVDREYALCQKISIDYAIMERVRKDEVAILPADLGCEEAGGAAEGGEMGIRLCCFLNLIYEGGIE